MMDKEHIELAIRVPLPPSTSSLPSSSFTGETINALRDPEVDEDRGVHPTSLAPVDRGFSAWAFLAAAFLIEALVWGFPNSSGVLLAAYLEEPVYLSQKHATTVLPLVGTLCTGIMYCSGIVIYPTIQWHPRVRRYYTWIGTLLCACSLLGAGFTTKVTTLVALQGVLFAVGGSLVYAPVVSYLSEWFVQRRGLANGIIFCGANIGGILFPLILPPLIERFGIMKTTRGYAVALFLGMLPALFFMKARLPETRVHGPRPRANAGRSWLRDRNLWFFLAINTVQGFGYFVPLTWLPTYASAVGLNAAQGSLTLALVNAAAAFSGSTMGFLSDKLNIWILAVSSLIFTSLVTFILWGWLSYSLAGMLVYGVAYGVSAGGWSSMWSGFVKPVAKDDPSLATTMYGYLLLSRGIGNILSTPISTALQQARHAMQSSRHKSEFAVADGQYQDMIIYTGTCFVGAAIIALVGWGLDRKYRTS